LALRVHAHAVCEKPLVINPWNLDALEEIEAEYGSRVYTVLQLRLHPALRALRDRLLAEQRSDRAEVCLTYITRRGPWYHVSWKGAEEKSGGLVMNIGIHFFDLLMWLFGRPERSIVHLRTPARVAGLLELERARVRWFLSIDGHDLPESAVREGRAAFRSITIDGEEVEFSESFGQLHTRVYEDILGGGGYGIAEARPSIDLVYRIRRSEAEGPRGSLVHPLLAR
ncbi:MAG: oxidoreductase, partial [Deltaproteobacteria bacterium]|nr:oxidoreductase [Deltaproteobacteria bacterium]